MEPLVTRGLRLRLLRTARELDAGELATRAGLSRNTISNIETDRFGGRPHTIDAVADALEVNREALEDDRACFRELARLCQVEAEPVQSTEHARLVSLIQQLGPDRARFVIGIVENLAGLVKN